MDHLRRWRLENNGQRIALLSIEINIDILIQRNAWLPYFTDIHAILFLAPISAFDERLREDRRVNRLEDSFILWQSICKSELLKNVILIRESTLALSVRPHTDT